MHYSDFRGIPELREALAAKLATQNGLDFTPDEAVEIAEEIMAAAQRAGGGKR